MSGVLVCRVLIGQSASQGDGQSILAAGTSFESTAGIFCESDQISISTKVTQSLSRSSVAVYKGEYSVKMIRKSSARHLGLVFDQKFLPGVPHFLLQLPWEALLKLPL